LTHSIRPVLHITPGCDQAIGVADALHQQMEKDARPTTAATRGLQPKSRRTISMQHIATLRPSTKRHHCMRTLCVRFSPEPLLSFGGDGAVIARSPLVDLTGLSRGETGGTADASCLALDASYLPHSRSRLSRPHFPGRKDEGRTSLSPASLETPTRAALGLVRLAPLMVAQPDYTPDHGDLSKSACLHRSRLHRPSRGAWQPQHTAPGALNDYPPIDMSLSGIAARRMPIHDSRPGRAAEESEQADPAFGSCLA
jgi:hypothetical protein